MSSENLEFSIDQQIVYPSQGVGKITDIYEKKVDFHFSAVKICLTKYRKGGIEAALNDAKGRVRKDISPIPRIKRDFFSLKKVCDYASTFPFGLL